MSEVLLQLVWVAAHHGLRNLGRKSTPGQWVLVHDITRALGCPPAPGGPR